MDALRLLFTSFIVTASFSSGFASKVNLELYYESLCPYRSNLIVNHLFEIFESDLASITGLKLIPYGNAKISPNGTIICQHGINECILNFVEACAIDAWPDVASTAWSRFRTSYYVCCPFSEHGEALWFFPCDKLNLDASAVASCYVSERGKEDYRNFASYIRNAYKGTTKPSACSESSMRRSIRKVKMDPMASLYTEVTSKSKMSQIGQYIPKWLDQVIEW